MTKVDELLCWIIATLLVVLLFCLIVTGVTGKETIFNLSQQPTAMKTIRLPKDTLPSSDISALGAIVRFCQKLSDESRTEPLVNAEEAARELLSRHRVTDSECADVFEEIIGRSWTLMRGGRIVGHFSAQENTHVNNPTLDILFVDASLVRIPNEMTMNANRLSDYGDTLVVITNKEFSELCHKSVDGQLARKKITG